jgi:hypothetical protein
MQNLKEALAGDLDHERKIISKSNIERNSLATEAKKLRLDLQAAQDAKGKLEVRVSELEAGRKKTEGEKRQLDAANAKISEMLVEAELLKRVAKEAETTRRLNVRDGS